MKKIILLSAFILTIAFGLCGCKKDDATVHFASETEQTAVVSSDVNRHTADSKEKKASSDGEQEQKAKDTADDTDESSECRPVRRGLLFCLHGLRSGDGPHPEIRQ